ncbi:gliding motility-associated ABC transporter substrate-binding protein GldG [Tenacibaculum sp. UWU-22]|uniref:gliding motility-associated ABC transporter substrate-binding protein GldG n=1 Tax=Tenacibaculum sp. UWU-22 TaxID=3234187 RepID=UPI0034DAF099
MSKKIKYIVFALLTVILFNTIGSYFYKRFDLTSDKRFTLAKITRTLLDKVDAPLTVKVYLEGNFPAEFKRLQIETRQFLEELRAKNANIIIRFINPDNIRKKLIDKGMMPSKLTVEEDGNVSEAIIFPWAEVYYKNKTETVSLLPTGIEKSQEEQLQKAIENLEYSFTNAINNLTQKNQKKIAVLVGNGELQDIYLYSFLKEISKKYHLAKFTLDSVKKNPKKTLQELTNFNLAIIANPTQRFSDEEKETLDQFIINGGKTLWMLDNTQADQDSLFTDGKMLAYSRDLNLTDFFFSYGIRINHTLIKDLYAAKISLATGNIGNQTQFKQLPWLYHPLANTNPNHAITKNVPRVRLQFANNIDTLKNNIKKTPLLVSSALTHKIGTPKIITLQSMTTTPKQEYFNNGVQLFGVLLEGKFTSMYKNRTKPFDLKSFKETSPKNKMIIIADGDVAKNQILKGKPYDLSFDKWTNEEFGNKAFLLNAVDYLLDDSGIIGLRNKTIPIKILDKQKVYTQRTFWQFFNIIFPLICLALFGFGFNYWRKKKYCKKSN